MRRATVASALIAPIPMLAACGGSVSSRQGDLFAFSEQSMHRIEIGAPPSHVCNAARNVLMAEDYVLAPGATDDPLAPGVSASYLWTKGA